MSKTMNFAGTAATAFSALALASAPMPVAAQVNGVTNCDAPGSRQTAGAIIGGIAGGLIGNRVARNERGLGTVAGAAAGAAAGSYIGCRQQRARAGQGQGYAQTSYGRGDYRATSNLRVRSGPGTRYGQVGSMSRGQSFDLAGSQGEWVRLSNGGWVNANYVAQN